VVKRETPMPRELDYARYYDIERYLFEDVHSRFHEDHFIDAFDFFSIVVWKANRAKSKIAKRLRDHASPEEGPDLDKIVRRLTASLYAESDARERLCVLLNEEMWGFRLPMASAILTVLWPDEFTVYDFRVCEQLALDYNPDGARFGDIWQRYCTYRDAVIRSAVAGASLRERDRWFWGRSAAEQLRADIARGFSKTD
jgi:hypothetical protein